MKWKLISDELKKVETFSKNLPYGSLFINKKYKKNLEWWVLGKMQRIVNKTKSRFPCYALDVEKNGEADFYISKNGKTIFKSIEITEVLKPGRKRSDEYKGKNVAEKNILNIWSSFYQRLEAKFKRNFGKDCWLIIYHNIRYAEITSNGSWHDTLLANMENIDFSSSKYEKIFVINSDGKAAVSIYPIRYVVYPELTDKSTFLDMLFIRDYNKLTHFLLHN